MSFIERIMKQIIPSSETDNEEKPAIDKRPRTLVNIPAITKKGICYKRDKCNVKVGVVNRHTKKQNKIRSVKNNAALIRVNQ